MAEFGMIKSFDIDHGELDGMTRQECFVLGYELASIDALLKGSRSISRPVHAANQERIKKSCHDASRTFLLIWPPDDCSEEWMQLDVPGLQQE